MQFARTALTTAAAAAFATTFGLAPAFAGPEATAPAAEQSQAVQSAGVAQQAEVGQAPIFGLPPVVPTVAVVAATFGLAIAASNSCGDNTPSTPNTR